MQDFNRPHQDQPIAISGAKLSDAKAAMIMIHGRGASAQSILGLSKEFSNSEQITFIAPQASNHTWYPYSFLVPKEHNQPGIDSGLQVIADIISKLEKKGFTKENIFLLGFSQGACLTSEFIAQNPAKYAGLIALSGGLIGETITFDSFSGNLDQTPVFFGCSDIDAHIPKERVNDSEMVFNKLKAKVTKRLYPGMGHLVNENEIAFINEMISEHL